MRKPQNSRRVHFLRLSNLLSALTFALFTAYSVNSFAHGDDDSSIGQPGVLGNVGRTVAINMIDAMRFEPDHVSVKQGETVRFVVKNSGKLKHEFVLGTDAELKEHYQVMMKFPDMEHTDPNRITVAPGQTGEVIWQFTKSGNIDFACLQPGHYDAGMKGIVAVAGATQRTK